MLAHYPLPPSRVRLRRKKKFSRRIAKPFFLPFRYLCTMEPVKFFLNISLLYSLLVAPSLVLMAYWYRKHAPQPIMVWKKPEMVIVTITFSIAALILFIVGVSSFFSYRGYLNANHIDRIHPERFFDLGVMCLLLSFGLGLTYLAIRQLLVRIVNENGIVENYRFFRFPDFNNTIKWHEICDYFIVSDYPNVIFNLLVRRPHRPYERVSVRVPIYVRDNFEELLEKKMNSQSAIQSRSAISRQQSDNS